LNTKSQFFLSNSHNFFNDNNVKFSTFYLKKENRKFYVVIVEKIVPIWWKNLRFGIKYYCRNFCALWRDFYFECIQISISLKKVEIRKFFWTFHQQNPFCFSVSWLFFILIFNAFEKMLFWVTIIRYIHTFWTTRKLKFWISAYFQSCWKYLILIITNVVFHRNSHIWRRFHTLRNRGHSLY
jgi:hypothetical protein